MRALRPSEKYHPGNLLKEKVGLIELPLSDPASAPSVNNDNKADPRGLSEDWRKKDEYQTAP